MQGINGLIFQSSAFVANGSSQLRAKLHSFIRDGLELVVPSPIHVKIILVVLPQRLSVGHGEQGDAHRPAVAVDEILHIYTHCTGALIQNGKLGLVVEQSGHLHK